MIYEIIKVEQKKRKFKRRYVAMAECFLFAFKKFINLSHFSVTFKIDLEEMFELADFVE